MFIYDRGFIFCEHITWANLETKSLCCLECNSKLPRLLSKYAVITGELHITLI